MTKERSQALATMQGYLHERIQGMQVTRSFALEEYEGSSLKKEIMNFNESIKPYKLTARTFSAVNTLTDLYPLLVIGFAAYEVIQGQLTLGTMVAFVGYMDSLYSPLRRLVNSSTTLTQSLHRWIVCLNC